MKNKKLFVETNSTYVQNMTIRRDPVNGRLASMISSEERNKRLNFAEQDAQKLKQVYGSHKTSPDGDSKTYDDKLTQLMDVPEHKVNNTIQKQ